MVDIETRHVGFNARILSPELSWLRKSLNPIPSAWLLHLPTTLPPCSIFLSLSPRVARESRPLESKDVPKPREVVLRVMHKFFRKWVFAASLTEVL